MNFAQPFSGIIYWYADLFGNANKIDIVLTTFQKIGKNTRGRLELLTSIVGLAQAWKVLEFRGLLEKSLKIKSALKSTGKSPQILEKSLNSTIFYRT